jgi:hypothetical protein
VCIALFAVSQLLSKDKGGELKDLAELKHEAEETEA